MDELKRTQATLDLQAIRARADRMERDHECPGDPKRAKWCAKEPCGTMQTVAQLRGMADEIERLRFLTSDLEACTDILTGQSDLAFPAPKTFRVKGFIVKVEPSND